METVNLTLSVANFAVDSESLITIKIRLDSTCDTELPTVENPEYLQPSVQKFKW